MACGGWGLGAVWMACNVVILLKGDYKSVAGAGCWNFADRAARDGPLMGLVWLMKGRRRRERATQRGVGGAWKREG